MVSSVSNAIGNTASPSNVVGVDDLTRRRKIEQLLVRVHHRIFRASQRDLGLGVGQQIRPFWGTLPWSVAFALVLLNMQRILEQTIRLRAGR